MINFADNVITSQVLNADYGISSLFFLNIFSWWHSGDMDILISLCRQSVCIQFLVGDIFMSQFILLYTFFPFFFYNAVNEHFFQVMGTCFCGNFHVNSLLCHSQTLHDSCCSSLCLVHGQLKEPLNLVYKLIIIALIWNNWSPFQFSKCQNSCVETINITMINAITMAPGLWTSLEG